MRVAEEMDMKNLSFLLVFCCIGTAFAKQFEVFDGQFYNGLYYPRVDNIEWGEQFGELPHMEFHVYSKERQVEVSIVPGDKSGKPVLWIMYDLRFRNERVCRHVLAPRQFREGMKVYAYKDVSDPDYNNFYFSSEPYKNKKFVEYNMPAYAPCTDEMADNKPDASAGAAGFVAQQPPAAKTTETKAEASRKPADNRPNPGKGVGVDYENQSLPFSY